MINLDNYPNITITNNSDIIEILENMLPASSPFQPHLDPANWHSLKIDYAIDSLDKVDLQQQLEQRLNISLDEDRFYNTITVGNLYELINRTLNYKPCPQ